MQNLREDIWAQPEEMARSARELIHTQAGELRRAADLLRGSGPAVLTGMGSSYFIALAAQYAGLELGLRTLAMDTGELCNGLAPWLEDAALLVVSRSGESAETVRVLEVARERRARVIAVTNCPESQLARAAEVVLNVGADPDHNVSVKMYNGPLQAAILALAQASGVQGASLLPELEANWANVGERLDGWERSLESMADLFEGPVVQYYLGRGAGYASACEGRLLSEEASKYPATADNAAAFRHGAIEVVRDGFRGILFLTPGTPMALTASLAEAIEGFGGKSLVLAPDGGPEPEVTLTLRFPAASPVLAPLFDITPAQLLALKMAGWRGADCNGFYRCSYIISEEE